MVQSPTDTTPMVYTPGEAADTFDIWYHSAGGAGTFTITDASGVLTTVTNAVLGTIEKATVTRPTASKLPISIAWASDGAIIGPISIEPYNWASPMLEIINMGGSGLTAQNWNSTGNNRVPTVGLPKMAFDTIFVGLCANDIFQGRTVPQYQGDLDALVAAIRTTSEVILTKANRPLGNPGAYDIATYLPTIDTVAAARGALAVVD